METEQANQLYALLSQSAKGLSKNQDIEGLMPKLPQNGKIGPPPLLVIKMPRLK